ncbi:hemin-degrading factor [Thorsellia anophelis]|uniref:Putative hemin transport protein n=1 Tax=Thorsellia anophelis DSM 18579 TaxID=1123402 RepID=A0A1I0EE64_9GAMM|nr:ChuX/HutX family heme-like substrate-binding protein [Thorsellia anophelis]SET43346.1 putative hemin transport protein [Thorsellia anophelis DSM 18579]
MSQSHNYQTYLDIKKNNPRLYAVDIALKMGITEAELAQIRIGFETTRLDIDPKTLLTRLESCGELKAITRNPFAVSEQVGVYGNATLDGHVGLILNPRAIDLRIFYSQWKYIFVFNEPYFDKDNQSKIRTSLQIFNAAGLAIHKIYVTENTDTKAFNQLISQYESKSIDSLPINNQLLATETPKEYGIDLNINKEEFESKWRALKDVHDFYGLLKSYKLTRQQAFNLVSRDLAYQICPSEIESFLNTIFRAQNEIMFFVSNIGCVQIFTGKLEKVVPMHGWLNIFNRSFTLHMQHNEIHEAWITRKPTQDGIVTSLELYAKDGTQILQMYGQRTEGSPEQIIWREQLQALSPLEVALES